MTLDELGRWLDTYGGAWERRDVDAFVGCFAEDALYQWGPWSMPLRRHEEIRARTFQAVSQQDDVRFGHKALAITPNGRGAARWWVSMRVPARGTVEEDEGISSSPSARRPLHRLLRTPRSSREPAGGSPA